MPNKAAVITGGSSGIGLEFANQLAAKGYDLLIVSIQEQELASTKEAIETLYPAVKCHTLYQNLATEDAADRVYDFCVKNKLDVEVLINNAGIFSFKEILEHSRNHLNLYIDLHIRAVTQMCYLFGNDMRAKKHGFILNMSSMSCWMPMPGIGMYSATKAYIRVFSRALRYELKDDGVNVMVACPGGLATDLFGLPKKWQKIGVRVGALATPRKFVASALKRMFNGKQQYINGLVNRIAIVAVALLPTSARMIVKHKLLARYGR